MTDTLAYIHPVVLNVFTQLICSSASHIVLLLIECVAAIHLNPCSVAVCNPNASIDVTRAELVASQMRETLRRNSESICDLHHICKINLLHEIPLAC